MHHLEDGDIVEVTLWRADSATDTIDVFHPNLPVVRLDVVTPRADRTLPTSLRADDARVASLPTRFQRRVGGTAPI